MLWVTTGVANLANYSFKFHYKTGKSNVEVDALTHIPWDREECETLDNWTVKAIMAECCCKVYLFELYMGYVSTSHKVQLASPAPGISIANKKVGVVSAANIKHAQWITEQN